jgi:hypothetical protein
MTPRIISADERLAQQRGPKILINGPTGVGKTSLLRTTAVDQVLFVDAEAGDLCIQDLPVPTIVIETWHQAVDLACRIGGPNPSYPPTARYSEAHFNALGGYLEGLERFQVIFLDSITQIGRLCLRWAEQQPESFTRSGQKDPRGAYGLMGREMIALLQQFQRTRDKTVIFVGVLEKTTDEFNRSEWRLQLEGQKAERELPGIVDEIISMVWIDTADTKNVRAFVCTSPNPWGFPAKDRSGRLQQLEPPDLGKLIIKLTSKQQKRKEN